MRDITNNLHVQAAFAPKAAVTDNTAQVSSTCDLKGFDACMLSIITGTNADADVTYTVLVEDSDDNSSFSAVDDAYLNGTEALAGFQFDDDGEVRKIGYHGIKRYVRCTITPANNTGNVFIAGTWICGKASRAPTANPPQ